MKPIFAIMSIFILALPLFMVASQAAPLIRANLPIETPTNETPLYQALLDIKTPWTIMCVAAHPDDEDSDGLAYYRMKYGIRTVLVTATRGEGGQNSQGPELYEDLGVIRTKELMATAQKLATIPFNLRMPDFGFSKSATETVAKWNRQEALRRMVYAIRVFRPDIIITVHDRKTGHGHHQATRILAEEAFTLAADNYAYPEQLSARLEPWQTKRFFVKTLSKDKYDTEFDANEVTPSYKQTYAQIGYESRQEHKTQGPWPPISYQGERMVRYNLVKKVGGEFRRWYYLWQGLETPEIYTKILPLIFNESIETPENALTLPREELLSRLINALNTLRSYLKEHKEDYKAQELEIKLQQAIILTSKVSLSITTDTQKSSPGFSFNSKVTVDNQGGLALEVKDWRLGLPDYWDYQEKEPLKTKLEPHTSLSKDFTISLGEQAALTLPAPFHLYDLDFLTPQVIGQIKLSWKDLTEPILLYTATRVEVASPIEMELLPYDPLINTSNNTQTNTYIVQVKVTNNSQTALPARLTASQISPIQITPETHEFTVAPHQSILSTFFVAVGRPIGEGAANLPITLFDRYGRVVASTTLTNSFVRLQVADVKVGYLRSYDFTLPQALHYLGVKNSALSIEEIGKGNLFKEYDTIILDNRAYLAYPDLAKVNDRLLEFVRDGGTLIVFYQRPSEWNNNELGPYPLKLGDDRITDENSPITFLEPDNPIFNQPNKITEDDFANWIQERGLSFPKQWDDRYHPLIASHDPDEAPLKGGLLMAGYGRGRYIYTSYVIYRQLRALHPGAYHIFANMISLPKAR